MFFLGNFKVIKEEIKKYTNYGINCLYLMGALERDNCPEEVKLIILPIINL